MNADKKSAPPDGWAIFGKVSAIVILICTLIGTIIAFYAYTANKPEIEASIWSSVYREAPRIGKDDKDKDKDYGSRLFGDDFKGYFVVTVLNVGRAQADNVVVDFPFAGVAEIRAEDEDPVQVKFRDSIALRSIRPNKQKTIYAWTHDTPVSYTESQIGVTHTQGVGRVTFIRETTGFWNALWKHMPGWVWPLLFALGLGPWIVQRIVRIAEEQKLEKRIAQLEANDAKTRTSQGKKSIRP